MFRQWDTKSWRSASNSFSVPNVAEPHGQAISPNGRIIATARWRGPVTLWDRKTGEPVADLTAHKRNVSSIDYSPDGRLLATACWDGSVKLWNTSDQAELSTLKGNMRSVSSVDFSPDGDRLACGSVYGVKLWDVATSREVATLPTQGHHLVVSFSPNGNSILATSRSGMIELWHAPSWRAIQAAEADRMR